jgi:hypothetical protein
MKIAYQSIPPLFSVPDYPYLALYARNSDIILVLITEPGKDRNTFGGFMVEGNPVYHPFDYYHDEWEAKYFRPFHGTLTITQE